jgi:DNA-binding MarR family transcriptional regulator
LAERFHRRSLDLLASELTQRRISDLNATQAMILIQMGFDEMTVSELMLRGCYLGSNVSYNLKKLTQAGYVVQHRSKHDRRIVNVSVSKKGQQVLAQLDEFYARIDEEMIRAGVNAGLLAGCEASLTRLDAFSLNRLSSPTLAERPEPAADAAPWHAAPRVA